MFGIIDPVTYFMGVLVIIFLPGPNSLYCLSVAGAYGIKAGYRTVLGILIGDSILIVVTVLGMGTLLRMYPMLFNGIKLIGGAYLAYIGTRLIYGAYQTYQHRLRLIQAKHLPPPKLPAQNFFYRALSLSLTNPKAILFLLSFFVQFVDPTYPHPFLSFFVLACILQAVSLAYLSLLVFFGRLLVQKFSGKPWVSILAMSAVGVLFLGFAANLWLAQLQ